MENAIWSLLGGGIILVIGTMIRAWNAKRKDINTNITAITLITDHIESIKKTIEKFVEGSEKDRVILSELVFSNKDAHCKIEKNTNDIKEIKDDIKIVRQGVASMQIERRNNNGQ